MPRLTKLDDVLFPVQVHPVFASFSEMNGTERRLPVPERKAIVNCLTRRVIGVVSRGYRLVTNEEALDMAYLCCQTVFPETHPGEWEVGGVDGPFTAGYCHIDLRHNSTTLDFSILPPDQRPDIFGPFIRVTNSYNGMRALGFEIGFFRKICKNGMISPEIIIGFKFSHLRSEIGKSIRFEIAKDRLASLRTTFVDSLAGLRKCVVAQPKLSRLLRTALVLRVPAPNTTNEMDWGVLEVHINEICDRYAKELGENAYAAFNAITEFASHPPDNRCVHRDRNSLQRLAGSWLTSFKADCQKPGFSIDSYLDQLEKQQAKAVPNRTGHGSKDDQLVEMT
jgi:hypothetical protein